MFHVIHCGQISPNSNNNVCLCSDAACRDVFALGVSKCLSFHPSLTLHVNSSLKLKQMAPCEPSVASQSALHLPHLIHIL